MKQMSLFEVYPSVPGAKRGGTSRAAAKAISKRSKELKKRTLQVLRRGPKTADEVANYLGEIFNNVRPRCTELAAEGLIEPTGARRASNFGSPMTVWRVKQ